MYSEMKLRVQYGVSGVMFTATSTAPSHWVTPADSWYEGHGKNVHAHARTVRLLDSRSLCNTYVNALRLLACTRMETRIREERIKKDCLCMWKQSSYPKKPTWSFAKGTAAHDFKTTFTPLNGYIFYGPISLYRFNLSLSLAWIKKWNKYMQAIYSFQGNLLGN